MKYGHGTVAGVPTLHVGFAARTYAAAGVSIDHNPGAGAKIVDARMQIVAAAANTGSQSHVLSI